MTTTDEFPEKVAPSPLLFRGIVAGDRLWLRQEEKKVKHMPVWAQILGYGCAIMLFAAAGFTALHLGGYL